MQNTFKIPYDICSYVSFGSERKFHYNCLLQISKCHFDSLGQRNTRVCIYTIVWKYFVGKNFHGQLNPRKFLHEQL